MRLSGWHTEICKLIGEGLPNREIKKQIQISDSRLSVLRANPLIQQQVEKYKRLHEDKYKKALDVFADNAADIAQEIVTMVKNPVMQGQTRLAAAKEVLDRASMTSDISEKKSSGETLTFEQLLRVTKTTHGDESGEEMKNFDAKEAFEDLTSDLMPVDSDVIDIIPEPVSFTKAVKPGVVMPSIKDNGGEDIEAFKTKLAGLIKH